MKRLLSWMRVVLPRDTIVATAVMADLTIEIAYLYSRFVWGGADETLFAGYRLFIQVVAALLYGGHRIATFHPACDAEYRRWLECTPWTPRHRLPMGPLHLVVQDVVVVAMSMLLTRIDDARVLYVPATFLASYCFSLAIIIWTTGQKLFAYGLAALLGLVIVFIQYPVGAFLSALITTAVTPLAVRQSLHAFPWELPWFANGRSVQQITEDYKQNQWGWPFDVFAPQVPRPWITVLDGVGASLLAGWWFLAIYYQSPQQGRVFFFGLLVQFLMIGIIARLGIYLKNHRSPISLGGRIWMLRPWQAGFDHVFLAPLAVVAVAVGSMLATGAASSGIPIPAWGGVIIPAWLELPMATGGLVLSLLILLLGGPSVERWRLAGRHRVVFQHSGKTTGLGSTGKNQEFVQIA